MTARSRTAALEAVVIWNPGAGSAAQAEDVRATLTAHSGIRLAETKSRNDAIQEVERACREGIPRIIAAGGDGTANAAVAALAGIGDQKQHPALAILPLGTGNDLARSLRMPLNPAEALEICLHGTAGPMDVLELTSDDGELRIAGNMITAGNTGKYLNLLTDELKQRWGALCYLRGAVNVLEELEAFPLRLELDDESAIELEALNLFAANGRTSGGGLTVCADARLDDGRMDLLVIRDGTGLDLAALTVDYLTSDLRENDLVRYHRCRRARVSCPSRLSLTTDGDALKASEFTVTVKPSAIQAVSGP